LLVSLVGTVAAEGTTTDPATEPETETPTTELSGATFFTHPVVKILNDYFGRNLTEETSTDTPKDETTTGTEDTTSGGTSETPETDVQTPESGLNAIGEQIAAYHEEGMGFGVLVKLYAMAEKSAEKCADQTTTTTTTDTSTTAVEGSGTTTETCTPVTADELVQEFQSGVGMGQLFKEYGKPALLGVGHVKKALKNLESQSTEDPTTVGDGTSDGAGDGTTVTDGTTGDQTLTGQQSTLKGKSLTNGKYNQKLPKIRTNSGKGKNK
jgi:hypothetical protein